MKKKIPSGTKTSENELEKALRQMTAEMGKLYRKQVLEALNKKTIDEFTDAKNYANVFLGLSEGVIKKLLKRFSNDRITRVTEKILGKVDTRNKRIFDPLIGTKSIIQTEPLELETIEWVKRFRNETLESFSANVLRAMSMGEGIEEIMKQFDGIVDKRKGQSKMIARTQINTFNSLLTKSRLEAVGVTKAIWRTALDERVRPAHSDREAKAFDMKEGLWSNLDKKHLLPGVDFNCRCTYEIVL